MTIRNLEIFVAVCEKMSMSAAANDLYVSQSAISQTIKELEAHFNQRLFERSGNKLYLTPPGRELLKYAKQLLDYYEYTETAMRIQYGCPHIRFGSIMPYVMIDLVAAARDAGLNAQISMHVYDYDRIISMLQSADLDLAIIENPIASDSLDLYPLMSNDMMFVCSEKTKLHPNLAKTPAVVRLEDFERIPVLVTEQDRRLYDQFFFALQRKHIQYIIAGTFMDYPSLERAIMNDLGVALHHKPEAFSSRPCKPFEVEGVHLRRTMYLVCQRRCQDVPEMKQFIDFILENTQNHYHELLL